MKNRATLVAFFLLANLLNGQNLIPNPGFELLNRCPTGVRQLEYAQYWQRANAGTPELFHSCGFSSNVRPFEGQGMAGVIFLSDVSSSIEYLQTPLTDTLSKGRKYCLNYYIRLSELSPVAINKIGVYFSQERLVSPDWKRFKKRPQIINQNVVDNTDEWVKVEGTYTAKGGEKFITIGNFYEKHYLIEKPMNQNARDWTVYYFLDKIELYETSEGCSSLLKDKEPLTEKEAKWKHIVYFEKDQFKISDDELSKLDEFIQQLPSPLYHPVKIEGHTDMDATFEYNVELSQKRANKVKERMINFELKNLYVTWSGEKLPLNLEKSAGEKALNRRVTITVER